jgi:DNA-directed RNA polymerase specialized sigma24 family protein
MSATLICVQAMATVPATRPPEPESPESTAETLREDPREEALDQAPEYDVGCDPDLWLYRDRTVGLLKRYFRISIEVGRLPSLLGREFFRTRVTSYSATTFEDAVIFVHDMEQSLGQLDEFEQTVIARVVLQSYSQDEAGRMLGCKRRTIGRRYLEGLDKLSEILLRGGVLTRLPATNSIVPKSCQEGESDEFPASCSEQAE